MRQFMPFVLLVLVACQSWASSGVILQYHHIATDTPPVTSTTPEDFRRHLNYLVKENFQVWPLPKLLTHLAEGRDIPEKTVSITFDDAYDNIYTDAWPELKSRGMTFTLFTATDFVGQRGYLSWEQLHELHDAGVTIANHTASHTHLLRRLESETHKQWQGRVKSEITKAQQALEKHLGAVPKLFAYPYGEYNLDILRIVEDLGYTGFGQQSGAAGTHLDRRVLPRFPLSGIYANLETFKTKMATRALPIQPVTIEPVQSPNGDAPALMLKFVENESLRLDQLVCYGPGGERTELKRLDEKTFEARALNPLPVGRSRYNCTMPVEGKTNGPVFYWYSQIWIKPRPDGSWYPEP